jgi:hypothetical protein
MIDSSAGFVGVFLSTPKKQMFTLPAEIKGYFERAIRQEMILTAFDTCNHLSKIWVRKELPRRFQLPAFCSASYSVGVTRQLIAVHLRTNIVEEGIEAQTNKAVSTLEKKINQGLKDGETITDVELHVDDQNMISGTVSGEGFTLNVKSIWNYRYGSNSANGILTVYAQTRVNRKDALIAA